MTQFKKKKISKDIVWIIDVWSYKIRVAICEYKRWSIKVLAFSEKRQSSDDIINNEIVNLEWVCDNIDLAIKKAEKEAWYKVENIVLNSVFSEIFFYSNKNSFHRQHDLKIISEIELENIFSKIEENYLYKLEDLELIISNISEIKLDSKVVETPLKETWKDLHFNMLNVFIPKSNFELINYIWTYCSKEVVKILPEEFCLAKIWEKNKEVVIINIGNSSSYITIKDNSWNIVWSLKIAVWIGSLIKKIKEVSDFSRAEIIKKIDRDDFYTKEKKEFLDIYSFLIVEALKDILWDKTCPNNFFIIGWGWSNNFFKNYFKKLDLYSMWLKITSKIKFILPDLKKLTTIENVEEILNKSNLNIISMIITYAKIIKQKESFVEKLLEKTLRKLIKKM